MHGVDFNIPKRIKRCNLESQKFSVPPNIPANIFPTEKGYD